MKPEEPATQDSPHDDEDIEAYERRLALSMIGGLKPLTGPIRFDEYNPDWPRLYEREAARITSILGGNAVRIEHVGSTSVPGLFAKPIIDIALEVPDSAREADYVPALEAAGYRLAIREPDWFEHRLFKGPDTNINLHTFTARCEEVDRMMLFRDRLRDCAEDRNLYARSKREIAARGWKYVQQYADAKTPIVKEIMARAEANRPCIQASSPDPGSHPATASVPRPRRVRSTNTRRSSLV